MSKSRSWPADHIERRPIDALIPYARNARTHSDEQVAQIAASMREWGWTNPVLVDEAGTIIAGHGRILAARQLGLSEAPVMVAKGWTEAQKSAYVIADNRLAEKAGWDTKLLALEIEDLRLEDFDIDLTGFSADALEGMFDDMESDADGGTEGLTDPDDVPEPPPEPITKPGDVWLMGKHRLMCGDSTDAESVARLMAGEKADSVLTDPPYGIGKLMNGGTWAKKNEEQLALMREWDDTTSQSFFDLCLLPKVPAVVWGGNYFLTPPSRCWLAWDKPEFPTMSSVELAWTNLDRNAKRIECSRAHQVDGAKEHATQKPIKVMAWSLSFLPEGNVFEPFGGSGTTIIACEQTGRCCYAMELSPQYVDVAVKRWQAFTGQTAVLESTGEPFPD